MLPNAITKQAWKCHPYYGGDIVKHNEIQKDGKTSFLRKLSIQRPQNMNEGETWKKPEAQ